jgi:hypothetical protein
MHKVAWIDPLPSQPGLVAFECESCLYLTSEILPPVKGALERNIGQHQSSSKIFSRLGNPTEGRFQQQINCDHRQ